ncbi:hypothetical protein [Burkholderia sp. MSMB1498]|uniref:hypothetical protein n=1 Tax=Burkholderia sp. MSMB1498 TaxID=1637842 RepID=UPI000ACA7753|nr:hypothetical protein [Burkholderia sp. MSMB1498]
MVVNAGGLRFLQMKKEDGSANRPANESRPLREDDTAARRGIRRRVRKAVRRATRWSPAPIRKSRCRRNGRRTARRSRAALQQAGWQTPHASPAGAALRPLLPLLPQVRADRLAALPKFSEGESARLAFAHADPRHAGSRLVLRLRHSHHAVSGVSRRRRSRDPADIIAALSAAGRIETRSSRDGNCGHGGDVRHAVLIVPATLATPLDAASGSMTSVAVSAATASSAASCTPGASGATHRRT